MDWGLKSGAPILVYFHGGYWRRGAREWYACMGVGVERREGPRLKPFK